SIVPSGSTTICSGYSVDLDAGSQFTNHLWNTGASTSTITASTIGQYFATMTDVNGCSGYTDTVDVTNLSVTLSTTGYSLCIGNVTLNAGGGHYIYNWNTGDTVSTITTGQPGPYFVTVIDENGCSVSSDTVTIYLNQFAFNINAIGTDSLCQPSGQVTLNAGSGYFSYLWANGPNSQQTTVNTTGSYTVSVTDMNGCPGVSNPFTVHNVVLTSAITGLSNVMQNNVENYSVIQNATSTYNWGVTGGILQSGLGTNSVDVLWNTPGQGSIYVIETDANGCIGDTISLAVTIFQSTDIIENPSQQISIFPNPFTKSTIISITNIKSNYNLTLYDITGQKVWKEEDLTQRTYELERGTLSKGIYFLEIKTEESKRIKRVVVN
ncbi:MAG TPA: T9SS type A sorting domain-containing protein, partial [Flavobacteriales bacterium]|nr:T9SS type A sorting domain-containing protein [Flavobacteriales bacterium]